MKPSPASERLWKNVEDFEGIGAEVFSINNEQRSLFIYEVIDDSL